MESGRVAICMIILGLRLITCSPPSKPLNFTALTHTTQVVVFTWAPPSDSGSPTLTGYTIYMKKHTDSIYERVYKGKLLLQASVTTFKGANLTARDKYDAYVVANETINLGAASDEVHFTISDDIDPANSKVEVNYIWSSAGPEITFVFLSLSDCCFPCP